MSDTPAAWTPDELGRRAAVETGGTVVASQRGRRDARLIAWAKRTGRFALVDRGTPWGNPHVLPRRHTPEQRLEVIRQYREHLLGRPDLLARLPELRGKVLVCWCHPLPCHGDVLLELLGDVGR